MDILAGETLVAGPPRSRRRWAYRRRRTKNHG